MRLTSMEYLRAGNLPSTFQATLGPRVTIVLGDNEAGKTTTWRALEALLFEPSRALVAPRTVGGFEFAATLQYGAPLPSGAPHTFRLHRRGKGHVVPPPPGLATLLRPELAGRFRDLFGLSLENLRPEATAFLGAEGALGSLLFGAQVGLAPDVLAKMIDTLDERIKQASSAGKKTSGLGVRLAEYDEARSRRTNVARFARFDELSAARETAAAAVRLRETAVATLEKESKQLEALLGGVGTHAQLQAAQEALAQLAEPHAPATPEEAAGLQRHRERLEETRVAVEHRRLAEEQARRAMELAPVASPVVALVEEIERLALVVERLRAQRTELLDDQERFATASRELARLVGSLGGSADGAAIAAAAGLLRPDAVRSALAQLLKRHGEVVVEEKGRGRERDDALQAATDARTRAAAAPVLGTEALERAAPHAEAAAKAELDTFTHDEARAALAMELERGAVVLGFEQVPEAERSRLPHPTPAEAKALELARTTARTALERVTSEVAAETKRRDTAKQSCEALRAALGDVPTAERIGALRRLRDEKWQALAGFWTPAFEPGREPQLRAIAAEFALLMGTVDELVERRATAAEDAGRLQAAEADALAADRSLGAALATQQEAAAALDRTERAWTAGWSALRRPPESAGEWHNGRDAWSQQHARHVTLAAAAEAARARRDAEQTNTIALVAAELPVLASLATAAARKQALQDELRRRVAANRTADRLRADLDAAERLVRKQEAAVACAEQERLAWARDWTIGAAALPAAVPAEPAAVGAWLANQQELDRRRRELIELQDRIEAREKSVSAHDASLAELLARARALDPALPVPAELAPRDAFPTLRELGLRARGLRDGLAKLREQHETAAHELELAARLLTDRGAALEAAWHALGRTHAPDDGELDELLARSRQAEQLRQELVRLSTELKGHWRSKVAAFTTRLRERGQVELEGERAACEARLAAERIALEQDRRRDHTAEASLRALDEAHDAIAVEQAYAEARVSTLEKAHELLRLEIARHLLEQARRSAAQQDTGLIARASLAFQTLTGGAYQGLRIDHAEGQEPALVAIEASREEKGPAALSSGTLDQLWLAVRLAAVEQAARETPFPLLLDDVFVQFDDTRTTAALRLLGTLSEHVQVILFTHHDHLVDLARAAIPEHLQLVTLPRPNGTPRVRSLAAERTPHERPFLEGDDAVEVLAPPARGRGETTAAEELIVAILLERGAPQGKAALIEAAARQGHALEAEWSAAIHALVEAGRVTQEGQKRGAKYAAVAR